MSVQGKGVEGMKRAGACALDPWAAFKRRKKIKIKNLKVQNPTENVAWPPHFKKIESYYVHKSHIESTSISRYKIQYICSLPFNKEAIN